jgi:hypothetical protein
VKRIVGRYFSPERSEGPAVSKLSRTAMQKQILRYVRNFANSADRACRSLHIVLREIFDEHAWQRFSAKHAGGSFSDFLRERHGRPRQRCC